MATYYTSSTALGGGVGSYADPFTLQEAFDTAIAGDEVRILNDGTYNILSTIDVDTNAGTAGNYITFRGRNSADTAYEMATISGSSLAINSHILDATGNLNSYTYFIFQDLRFTTTTGSGRIWTQVYNRCRRNLWKDCRFDNCSGYGLTCGHDTSFYNCEFHDNSINLFGLRSGSIVSCCSFRDGAVGSSNCEGDTLWIGCVFYNFTSNAHQTFSGTQRFVHCTFDGCSRGIYDCKSALVTNCLFSNLTIEAVNFNSSYYPTNIEQLLFIGNYFYNNTSDINITPNDFMTANNTFAGSDPQYVNTTAGAEDYNLQSGSPAIGTGVPSSFELSGRAAMTANTTPGTFAAAIAAAVSSVFSYMANFTRLG